MVENTDKYEYYNHLLDDAGEVEFSPLELKIFNVLYEDGPHTRAGLMKKTKAKRTTVYDNFIRLKVKTGMVKKFTRHQNERGRPLVFFKIKDSVKYGE